MSTSNDRVRFINDDRFGAWKAGDEAVIVDVMYFDECVLYGIRLEDGQVLDLTDPFSRGLIETMEGK